VQACRPVASGYAVQGVPRGANAGCPVHEPASPHTGGSPPIACGMGSDIFVQDLGNSPYQRTASSYPHRNDSSSFSAKFPE